MNISKISKKTWAIVSVLVFSLILVIVYLSKYPKQPEIENSPSPVVETLLIIKIIPPDGTLFAAGTKDPFFVYTNKEINPLTMVVISEPEMKFDIKTRHDDPLRTIVTPQKSWVGGITYNLTIKNGLESKDGVYKLSENFTKSIKIDNVLDFGGGEAN